MSHSHPHGHDRLGSDRRAGGRRLVVALLLTGGYALVEVVGGLLANSLALLADAGHMMSDVAALGLSLYALRLAGRPPSARRTFGHHRAEVLAALANAVTLLAAAVVIVVQAVGRLRHPPPVEGPALLGVAVGGLVVNLLALWVLAGGRAASLNVRGAWLHVLSDALGSVGAIAAGGLVWAFGWHRADPLASAGIAVLVAVSGWRLLAETAGVLMEGVPAGIDLGEVEAAVRAVPGVAGVHDLHVWALTSGVNAVTVHVVAEPDHPHPAVLRAVRVVLGDRFGLAHSTVQVEPAGFEEEPVGF